MRMQIRHTLPALLLCLAAALPATAQQQKVIAIDVLLEPDQTMVAQANAINARLRADYPKGYALDATHAPHITMLQCFVREKDFHAVTGAVVKVRSEERFAELQLKATGLISGPWDGVALHAILVERTAQLMRLQQKVAEALAPYSVSGGTSAAFIDTPPGADIVGYVTDFVPKSSGTNYMPHVTVGASTEAFAKKLKAEPFEAFSFRPTDAAIYQLGNFGTAAKELWRSPAVCTPGFLE